MGQRKYKRFSETTELSMLKFGNNNYLLYKEHLQKIMFLIIFFM